MAYYHAINTGKGFITHEDNKQCQKDTFFQKKF